MISRAMFLSFGACGALAACDGISRPAGPLPAISEPALVKTYERAPPGAPEGSCWGKDVTPAKTRMSKQLVLVQPAQVLDDGTVVANPIYRREDQQVIVRERRELWFQTPCETQLTPDFIASLQRALQARGHFHGAISGTMDSRTQRAIRRYQAPQGLDSSILSLAAARKLGLVAVERPAATE